MHSNRGQACWGLKMCVLGETFPQDVAFWLHHGMRVFSLSVLFGEGVRRGQSFWSVLISSSIRVTVLRCLSSVKRDELGSQVQVSSDTRAFLSQMACSKNVCSFYSAAQCIPFSLPLYKCNDLWSKHFSDYYYTDYRQIAVSLCSKSILMSEFFYFC